MTALSHTFVVGDDERMKDTYLACYIKRITWFYICHRWSASQRSHALMTASMTASWPEVERGFIIFKIASILKVPSSSASGQNVRAASLWILISTSAFALFFHSHGILQYGPPQAFQGSTCFFFCNMYANNLIHIVLVYAQLCATIDGQAHYLTDIKWGGKNRL